VGNNPKNFSVLPFTALYNLSYSSGMEIEMQVVRKMPTALFLIGVAK
jgi:hypothetical protein